MQVTFMSTISTQTGPIDPNPAQGLTTDELDDLIWDIAVGRPTRVVLDTPRKRATYIAVSRRIREAVSERQPSGVVE